jgi:single-strand DNA-binding protein
MASLNEVKLIGHLGKDPELRQGKSGVVICNFSLATTEKAKEGDALTEWHNIVVFGKIGEMCSKFLKKGSCVLVSGRIGSRKYQDKEGIQRTYYEILAYNVLFLDKKQSDTKDVQFEDINGNFDDIPF